MEANQNSNQYFSHHQHYANYIPMNTPFNSQLGHPSTQFYGFSNFFCHPNYGFPQQIIYHPSSFISQQSINPIEQNANFISEDTSQADIEKLLLETIPNLDGTEGNFEIRKFFKKFDAYLQDWSDKKKIFALKSKLYGKAKSFFILAIKSKRYNYKSIKNFILCKLLPSEYKVEESIDLIKMRTNSPQQKKNLKGHENNLKPQKIPTPSLKNKVNIQFEKEEFSKEILEFFEMPINQDSAKNENNLENLEEKFLEKLEPIVEKEFKLVDELKNSVPTKLHEKEIKKDIKEKNLLVDFEKEAEFDLPMNLFEEKAENKFKEESDISEKDLDIGLLEDFGKEQFCGLDEELICSLEGKQDFVSVEIPIPTEIHVYQEIVRLDIPVSHEEIKEEIVCSESEECSDLEKVSDVSVDLKENVCEVCDDLKEFGKEDCVDLKEKESEECSDLKGIDKKHDDLEEILEEKDDEKGNLGSKLEVIEKDPEKEILPTRDKLELLEEDENIMEKRNVLRSKLKEAKIMRKLRFEIVRNDFEKDFGFFERKITGRFFLEVRRCLNFEKLVTLIRVPKFSRNLPKEMDHRMHDLKPKKVLYLVSVTKQDVIRESKDAEIEKDWKKRKRKQEKGLVESVSVTEFLTIGVHLETFHRRSGLKNRVDLENPMINFDTESKKDNLATQNLSGKQAEMEEHNLTSRTPSSEAGGM